jgi:hypothetical protein
MKKSLKKNWVGEESPTPEQKTKIEQTNKNRDWIYFYN